MIQNFRSPNIRTSFVAKDCPHTKLEVRIFPCQGIVGRFEPLLLLLDGEFRQILPLALPGEKHLRAPQFRNRTFALEPFACSRIVFQHFGQELQRDVTGLLEVFASYTTPMPPPPSFWRMR